jgi:hypothetical protein
VEKEEQNPDLSRKQKHIFWWVTLDYFFSLSNAFGRRKFFPFNSSDFLQVDIPAFYSQKRVTGEDSK